MSLPNFAPAESSSHLGRRPRLNGQDRGKQPHLGKRRLSAGRDYCCSSGGGLECVTNKLVVDLSFRSNSWQPTENVHSHARECVQADPSRLSAAVKQKWKMDAEVCVTDEDSDNDAVPAHKTAAFHSGGVGPSRPSVINHFIAMGFDDKMTEKVVRSKGEENTESILDTLLESSQHVETPVQNFSTSFHDSINLGRAEEVPEQLKLIELGYSADEASAAINRCGQKASFFELIDSITAARLAAEDDTNIAVSPVPSDCESYDSNDSITAGRLAAEDDTNIAVSPTSSDCESYDSNDHISKKRRRS